MPEHFNEPATMIALTAQAIKDYADEHGIKLTRNAVHGHHPHACARYVVAHSVLGKPADRMILWGHLEKYGYDPDWGDRLEDGFEGWDLPNANNEHPAYLEGVKLAKLAGY